MSAREGEWDHATRPAEPQDASDFYNDVSSFGSDYIIVITALATPIARRFCGARARSVWGPGPVGEADRVVIGARPSCSDDRLNHTIMEDYPFDAGTSI